MPRDARFSEIGNLQMDLKRYLEQARIVRDSWERGENSRLLAISITEAEKAYGMLLLIEESLQAESHEKFKAEKANQV